MTTPSTNLGDLIDRSLPQDRIAIVDLRDPQSPREYTHRQIDELAGGVARYLQSQGYRPGTAIAIAALNRAEYIAAYFGIMRAGMVAVPLNIKVPEETLRYFLSDSDIRLAFVDDARYALLKDDVPLINFDDPGERGFASVITPSAFVTVEPTPDDIAMTLYTSGSTGRPKGVPLTHAGQRWALQSALMNEAVSDVPGRYLVAQPLFHMNGLFLTKRVFAANGLLVVMPAFNEQRYLRALSDYKINFVTVVPTMFAKLLRDSQWLAQHDFSALKKIVLSSAPTTLALVDRIKAAFPGVQLGNSYGTTEAGPTVFGPHPQGIPTPPLALGYPLPQSEVALVGGESADQGVLRMRNPAVTPGYHRLPEKSAQVLQDGWYDSGDVMRRDAQGFYYFVGRADDMFICSGENIYPVEVEKTLESHPQVRQACVVPLPDEERGQVPVAFVVLRPGSVLDDAALKQHALRHAPAYQHPRRIAFVSELPWAGTNKVDRNALLALARQLELQQRWHQPEDGVVEHG
ncbi:AMP-binding enzyme family protein 13 (plasmid) [Sodalis praecaptivus]|uniref:AMP-binding enzyme family protein 13 n=1 Tax=Sodalis praecaptivus TaxID=1239307 RepID=W0I2W2_9GAMM|nr:class I adenylate-forming enzyme family protein [Sodalis praecaptivus]AHF79092.1 AMP-binding enzyme family protein 13 [Sodalis praecaptivus]